MKNFKVTTYRGNDEIKSYEYKYDEEIINNIKIMDWYSDDDKIESLENAFKGCLENPFQRIVVTDNPNKDVRVEVVEVDNNENQNTDDVDEVKLVTVEDIKEQSKNVLNDIKVMLDNLTDNYCSNKPCDESELVFDFVNRFIEMRDELLDELNIDDKVRKIKTNLDDATYELKLDVKREMEDTDVTNADECQSLIYELEGYQDEYKKYLSKAEDMQSKLNDRDALSEDLQLLSNQLDEVVEEGQEELRKLEEAIGYIENAQQQYEEFESSVDEAKYLYNQY